MVEVGMGETAVGVRDLKTRLSAYLRLVKQGESITVTEHGRPVGRLVPLAQSVRERLTDLADAGILEWSGRSLGVATPRGQLRGRGTVADLIIEDRQ
jgi:prevent-host-death family protein